MTFQVNLPQIFKELKILMPNIFGTLYFVLWSNVILVWKPGIERQNCGDSEKIMFARGCEIEEDEQAEHRGFSSSETTLFDTLMEDTCH